jgi:hypothetical protein
VNLIAPAERVVRPDHDRPQQNPGRGRRHYRKLPGAAWLLALVLLVVAGATVTVGGFVVPSRSYSGLAPACYVVGAFFFIAAVVIPAGISREMTIEAAEHDSCERDCRRLKKALSRMSEETLRDLMVANFRQMRTFTKIAQRQARMSYYASLIGASVSLLILAAGAAVTVGLTATPAKVTVGCLAGAGTALSVFLSRTFLRTYEMTSRQMSYYYGQPLVHCYLLHAEWLTAQVAMQEPDQAARLRLWHKAIQATIQASVNAQDHLFTLNETATVPRPRQPMRRPAPAASPWAELLTEGAPLTDQVVANEHPAE